MPGQLNIFGGTDTPPSPHPRRRVRPTSLKAFRETAGARASLADRVLAVVAADGPVTATQLDHALDTRHANKRLSELRRRGKLAEVGMGECPITGRKAVLWDLAERAPANVVIERAAPFTKADATAALAVLSGEMEGGEPIMAKLLAFLRRRAGR